MYIYRLQAGDTIANTDLAGRTFRLVETRYKGRIQARALVVSGGPSAFVGEVVAYRDTPRRVFDIDPIVIRPETGFDRLGKKLGLNLEAQLGDASIDAGFYFETATKPEVVKDLFADPAVRRALCDALGRFDVVIIGPPGGTIAGLVHTSPERLTFSDVPRVRALEDLVSVLPEIRARPAPHPFAAAVVPMVSGLVLNACIVGGLFATTSAAPLESAIAGLPVLIGIAAAVVIAWPLFYFAFRHRANGFLPWNASSLVSLVALPFITVGVANQLNRELDTSKSKRYEVGVVDYQAPRKNQSGRLRVKGLPSSMADLDKGIADIKPIWMPRPPCKRLALDIAPGYFGNPWVSKVACLPGG